SSGASIPRRLAVAGEIMTALSQVSLVMGRGNSSSQMLLAKRPSKIYGSGRKTTSRAPGLEGGGKEGALAALSAGRISANAEASMNPSCSDFLHQVSKSAPCFCFVQYSRTISYAERPGSVKIASRMRK